MFRFIEKIYNRIFTDNIFRRIRKLIYTKNWFKNEGLKNPQPPFRKDLRKSVFFVKKPPPFIKQKIVKAYAKQFSINILIETGTFYGDMVIATRKTFKKIYSIELDETLYRNAKQNCSKYPHISLYHGDSAQILPKILLKINQPCLFWLDAHYHGEGTGRGSIDTPIMQELQTILNNLNHHYVILIDDAQDFVGKNDYPKINEVRELIFSYHPNWRFMVKDDIIRIFPNLFKKS